MRILVVGATGMLGRPVARRLLADGHHVSALARDPMAARRVLDERCEIVPGDVTEPATLAAACAQCDAVHVSLRAAGSLESCARVERDGLQNLVDVARAAGVRRLGLLSGAGIGESAPISPLIAIKAQVVSIAIGSGIPYTIFKPTHFMESLPLFIRSGRATVIGRQPHRYHYLAASDYADVVARAYAREDAANCSLTLFGPEAFTMAEALGIYRDIVSPGMAIGSLPTPLVRLLALIRRDAELAFTARLFDSFARMGEPGDPSDALRLFGPSRTTLAEWCRARAAGAVETSDEA